jgi:hypothetical protein
MLCGQGQTRLSIGCIWRLRHDLFDRQRISAGFVNRPRTVRLLKMLVSGAVHWAVNHALRPLFRPV